MSKLNRDGGAAADHDVPVGRVARARRRVSRAFRPSRRAALSLALLLILVGAAIETVRWVSFYQHADAAQETLRTVEQQLDLTSLNYSRADVEDIRVRVLRAEADLEAAERHVDRDPLLVIGRRIPGLRGQAVGTTELVRAVRLSVATSVQALDVLLAYASYTDDPGSAALEEGVGFLDSQAEAMAAIRRSLDETRRQRARIPTGLASPLNTATADLDRAVGKLDTMVTGYERASLLLPELLGFRGARTYLLLAQNDTELFPSGGLISNYGVVTFDGGRVSRMDFEYFGTLFRRWQRASGNEYVEPPGPLKQYLLRGTSWALGEAGWYPDFPTTAELAGSFVEKGGVSAPDGTIAIDLQFVEALLQIVGPITVAEYGIRVDAANLNEVTLVQTRDEAVLAEGVGKGFLSALAGDLLERIFATPKEQWLGLIQTLDRMGSERHLQLHFTDPALQVLTVEYGFDGGMVEEPGDFLLLTDTSVRSTKLNLILENSVGVDVRIDGAAAEATVSHTTTNPFPDWQRGRDPRLVRALMLDGAYGSYLRLYAPPQAQLLDLRVSSQPAGAQQVDIEYNKRVFARFTPVLPGETKVVEFRYRSEGVVDQLDDGWQRYRLYVQKQPGTGAIPLTVRLNLPADAEVRSTTLDGHKTSTTIATDLRVDRTIEVIFHIAHP